MLSPNYINHEIPERVVELMNDIETDMLKRVAHYIRKFDKVTGSAEFLSLKQSQYGLLYNDLVKIVAEYAGRTEEEIRRAFTDAAITSLKSDNKVLGTAGAGVNFGAASVGAMEQTLQAAIQRAIDINNLSNTRCIQSAMAEFTRAIDRAFLAVSTGAESFDTAYRRAVVDIAEQGITEVTYSSGGKEYHYTVEAAIRRAIITSVNQTVGTLQMMNLERMGGNLVQTSSHAGARPSHAVWQGRASWVFTPVRGYESFKEVCGYGEVDGICGVNCRHSFGPYLEGNPLSYERNPAKELGISNDELYYLEQQQRYCERNIRKYKKRKAVYEAAGLQEEAAKANVKVREWQARTRELIRDNPPLRRDYTREQI